jgi:hypothetical protein
MRSLTRKRMKVDKVISWQFLMITISRPETHENKQKLLRGSRGVVFSKRTPMASGGKSNSWQSQKRKNE